MNILAPLVHPAQKPQPRLVAKVTPRTLADPDEFEAWVTQQGARLASMVEVPEGWELPLAHHPRGYLALTSAHYPQLVLNVGTEVKTLQFDKPLPAGQPVIMWVNKTTALAA
jgi:hypothetical protein